MSDSQYHRTSRRAFGWSAAVAVLAVATIAGSAATTPARAESKPAKSGMMPPMAMKYEIERLAATEEIRELKTGYFIAADAQDWKALRAVFTDNATIDLGIVMPDGKKIDTPDAFVGFLSMAMKDIKTQHHGHNFQVTFTSPTEADGRWDYEVWSWYVGTGTPPAPDRHAWGQYHEHYTKTATGWRIASEKSVAVHADK